MKKSVVVSGFENARKNFLKAKGAYIAALEEQRATRCAYLDVCVSSLENLRTIYDSLDEESKEAVLENLGGLAQLVSMYEGKNAPAPAPGTSPYDSMTPGQKAAYTRRMNAEKRAQETRENLGFTKEKGRELREQLGYSRPELASKLKMAPRYITSIERGDTAVGENLRGKKLKRYLSWYQENQENVAKF